MSSILSLQLFTPGTELTCGDSYVSCDSQQSCVSDISGSSPPPETDTCDPDFCDTDTCL